MAETEIEFNKAFELLNGNYQKSSGALFGIFSADCIEADMTGMKATEKASTGPDTLIGIISPKNGEGLLKTHLPIGHKYYLKELETGEKYLLNESKYFFYVSDDVSGEHFNFKYNTDGIYGYAYSEGNGDITLKVSIESRYPVPVIIIDGRGYRLDENIPKGEETNGEVCFNADNVAIRENGDRTDIKILVKKEKPRDILLPNGKKLIIKADEEETAAYTVIFDGTLSTFSPVSRTYGSNLKFRHEYVPSEKAKDDLSADIEFVSLETAGYVTKNTVDIKITHKPKTKLENTDTITQSPFE